MGTAAGLAQTEQVITSVVDSSRMDRVILLDVRLPSEGEDAWPWIVFGHGFVMPPSDYDDLAWGLAASGYAVVMVNTETGFAPSHADFGLDLAYVVNHAASEAEGLEGLLSDRVALMGHSMGGGAAWLAASQLGSSVDALVGLAPAETSPSAVATGEGVLAPVLVLSGSSDAITTPEVHHHPLFEAASNAWCKAFVNLVNGGHCGFADAGTLCDLGEIAFPGMTRFDQQAHSLACIQFWLDAHLGEVPGALDSLEVYADSESDVELDLSCDTQAVSPNWQNQRLVVGPNPSTNVLQIWPLPNAHLLHAYDLWGRELPVVWATQNTLDVSSWPRGTAVLCVQSPTGQTVSRSTVVAH